MSKQTDTAKALKRAAARKRDADDAYRAALRAAHEAGMSYAEIARCAGTSRQRVRQLLTYRAASE